MNEAGITIYPNPHPNTWEFSASLCFEPQRCGMFSPIFPYIQTLNISFCFEWRGSDTQEATKYTWTVFPLGFGNSPQLFGTQGMESWERSSATICWWLISTETKQDSDQNTVKVLNFLVKKGCISSTKAQISQQWVQYLGSDLTPKATGQRRATGDYNLQPQRGNAEAFSGWLGSVTSGFQIMALKPKPSLRL